MNAAYNSSSETVVVNNGGVDNPAVEAEDWLIQAMLTRNGLRFLQNVRSYLEDENNKYIFTTHFCALLALFVHWEKRMLIYNLL